MVVVVVGGMCTRACVVAVVCVGGNVKSTYLRSARCRFTGPVCARRISEVVTSLKTTAADVCKDYPTITGGTASGHGKAKGSVRVRCPLHTLSGPLNLFFCVFFFFFFVF